MSEYRDFILAIATNPDDMLPRLIFADWLDENGYCDRAEFIRLEVQDRGLSEPRVDLYHKLRPPLPAGALYYNRGMFWSIWCTLADFEANAAIWAYHHPITRWYISDRQPVQVSSNGWYWAMSDHYPIAKLPMDLYLACSCCYHPSREVAVAALSDACVKVANSRADKLTFEYAISKMSA